MMQILIALDQLVNTFVPPYKGDHRGWADETLSSRAWRRSSSSKGWETFRKVVDWIFWKLIKQKDHCFESWMEERLLRQMPPELRKTTQLATGETNQ